MHVGTTACSARWRPARSPPTSCTRATPCWPSATSTRRRRPTSWWCRAAHHPDVAALAAADPAALAELVAVGRQVATAEGHDDYRLVFNTGAAGRPVGVPRARARARRPRPQLAARVSRPLPDGDRRRGWTGTLAGKQAEWRSAGLAAGVVRHGEPAWRGFVGTTDAADPDATADRGHPVPDGLDHQDVHRGARHAVPRRRAARPRRPARRSTCPAPRTASLTIRRMLAHRSGLQREPVGEVWEQPEGPLRDELLAGLAEAEAVLPPASRYHYSNLAYALLGEVVAGLRREPWEDALRDPGAGAAGHAPDDAAPHPAVRPRLLHRPVRRPAARASRSSPATRSRRPPSCGRRSTTWPGGPRSSPTPTPPCSPRTPSRRCATRR